MVHFPYFLPRCLVPHQLHGRLTCLGIRFQYAALVASAAHMLCLFPPPSCSMKEHLMQDNQLVGGSKAPPGVVIQEELGLNNSLCFSEGEPLLFHLAVGDPALLHPVTIVQHQNGQITRENNNNVFTCHNTDPTIILAEVS